MRTHAHGSLEKQLRLDDSVMTARCSKDSNGFVCVCVCVCACVHVCVCLQAGLEVSYGCA